MIRVLSTNIVSPLGFSTEENYQAVKSGHSAIKRYNGKWDLPDDFAASLFTEEQISQLNLQGHSRFESLVLYSVREALSHVTIDVTSPRVIFILSTTKGNIELLANPTPDLPRVSPGTTAEIIAHSLGITTVPIVVCNACISGAAAQMLALRLLEAKQYDYAIVTGAEVQSPFIVSGFQSLKAVSADPCRPFDMERIGLNLGEAAATIVFSSEHTSSSASDNTTWHLKSASVRNDAFHISAPSPKADGAYHALMDILGKDVPSQIGCISVHGTATMYNDQMESIAIARANLSDVPLSALKGYYGHTMGAAGVLETIITMRATEEGLVLPSRGFKELGVSGKVSISPEMAHSLSPSFIKMLSGFAGCNVALLYALEKGDCTTTQPSSTVISRTHTIHITDSQVEVDGKVIPTHVKGKEMLTALCKSHCGNYAKFYKMDMLTRLAFIASELLLQAENPSRTETPIEEVEFTPNRSIILFNHSSSIQADTQYQQTIQNKTAFFPSPSIFVYTLPNITTGEIAIRNHYQGETSFYILPAHNQQLERDIILSSLCNSPASSLISGWIDCPKEDSFEATLHLYIKKASVK